MAKTEQLQIRVSAAQKRALRCAARRAGMSVSAWVLASTFPESRERFHALVARLHRTDQESYALAELNDLLTELSRDELKHAIAQRPRLPRDARLQNHVAAMVELASYRRGIPQPAWTREIAALEVPYFGSTLVSLRLHLLVSSPPPFRRRNLFVDASLGDRV